MADQNPQVLDLQDVIEPLALLKILHTVRSMLPGDSLHLLVADAQVGRDVCKVLGNQEVDVMQARAERQGYALMVCKQQPADSG